jgi:hypothetical protein
MFLAKHFEFGFAFFLNTLDARLDECWCGCNLSDVKNLSNDRDEVFEGFQRGQEGRDRYTTKGLGSNV